MTGVGVMLILLLLWKMAGYMKGNVIGEKAGSAFNGLGEACLEQIWKERYPLAGADLNNGDQVPWYVLMIKSVYPSFHYKEKNQKPAAKPHSDPSYERYLDEQRICREYQYLFLYGGEDTSLDPSQQADTMVPAPPPIEEKTEELDPSIARPGEKVIAIMDSAYIGIGYEINTGEIYTVSSYNKGSYTFEECPPSYNPYLGEDGTWWFDVKDFRKIEEE